LSSDLIRRTFALTIAYDGTRYAGWQNQLNSISVQQRLEEAAPQLATSSGETGPGY
jgi:tRNA pseudouridine38-40 synthase